MVEVRLVRWTATLAVVFAACSGSAATGTSVASTGAPATSVASETTTAPVASAGRLVVLDGAGDVVTLLPDGTDRQTLTDGTGTYRQPLWSPAGEALMWAETSSTGFNLVVFEGVGPVPIPMPALPFFSMWSPDGSRIGVLHNAAGAGLEFEIVDVSGSTSGVAATGAPFYFSWSPDGSQIVTHVGASVLSILGSEGGTRLGSTRGDYQAPSWTGAGIVHLFEGALVLQEPGGDPRRIATVTGPTTIVADSKGERVAVQVFGPEEPSVFAAFQTVPEIPVNAVVVLDPATGAIEVASGRTSFGFFWSPDGASLLILVSASQEGELEWWVWRDGEVTTRVAFTPGASLVRDLLPFFDQYAQAWSPWAPASSAFAFVGTIDGTAGVWVQDLDGSEPRFLIEGDWVAWSAG